MGPYYGILFYILFRLKSPNSNFFTLLAALVQMVAIQNRKKGLQSSNTTLHCSTKEKEFICIYSSFKLCFLLRLSHRMGKPVFVKNLNLNLNELKSSDENRKLKLCLRNNICCFETCDKSGPRKCTFY